MKTNLLGIYKDKLITTDKKIIFLSPYNVESQLFGPKLPISQTAVCNDLLLTICNFSKEIFLFKGDSYLQFVCDEFVFSCCFIDENFFVVGSENFIYVYDVNKKKYLKKIFIENIRTVYCKNEKIFVGCNDRIVIIDKNIIDENFEIKKDDKKNEDDIKSKIDNKKNIEIIDKDMIDFEELKINGIVNCICEWNEKLLVAVGRENKSGRFVVRKNVKNMLMIFENL
ncbi:hypothetical protein GVAV_000423 [Gurleya vavrai]